MPLEHLCELTPVVALLSFEHLKTTIGSIETGSILHHALFLSYTYFLVCPHLILYFFTNLYLFLFVYLYWGGGGERIILQNSKQHPN